MTGRWHLDDALLTGWVDGSIGAVPAASVEQHVVACAQCRDRVRRAVNGEQRPELPELERGWAAVRNAVEVPPPSRLERALTACGLSAPDAMLAAAAPALRGAWLGVVAFVLLFVPAASYADARASGVTLFLLIAPLVPVAGVALAYSVEADPALEQEAATPYPKLRLVLLRVAAVLAVTLPMVAVAGVFLPARVSVLWLLPATGFTAAVLAVSTWTDPARAAIPIAVGWAVAVGAAAERGSSVAVLTGGYLLGYPLLIVGGLVAFIVRTRRLGVLGRFS
jgi:hypothetical protein